MYEYTADPHRRPALVSGASSGIGAASARRLAALGHPVALGARRAEACAELAGDIRDSGGDAFWQYLDVSDPESVRDFVASATHALGGIEILVCGTGELRVANIHESAPEEFAAVVDAHLAGTQRLVSAVVPGMVERTRGDVVLLGSDVVRSPRPRVGGYVPAKSGVEAMGRSMQMELEGTGVRTSILRPGPTDTAMGTDVDESRLDPLLRDWIHWGLARHPNFLRADDVAAAVSTVVSAPRGVHISVMEIEPEAPVAEQ